MVLVAFVPKNSLLYWTHWGKITFLVHKFNYFWKSHLNVALNFHAKITVQNLEFLGQKDVFCPSVLLNKSLRYIFMLEKLGEQKQKPQIKRLPHAPQYSLLLWSRPNAIHLRNDWASSNQYKWKRAVTWQMTSTSL